MKTKKTNKTKSIAKPKTQKDALHAKEAEVKAILDKAKL